MADAVSKLYAEIGFKVNQDGLKQAQQILKGLAKQMSDINNATKEAARQYGIFSENRNKQSLNDAKVATEASKQSLNQKRIQIMGIKELQRQEDRMAKETRKRQKEEEAEKKKEEKEKEQRDKETLREENKAYKERLNNLKIFFENSKRILKTFQKLGKGLFITLPKQLKLLYETAYKFMQPSLDKAYEFENFSFESGMKLGDFQKFQRMFLLSGIRLSPQDLMADMLNVQRNLTKVALNQGGVLDAYKLMDVREAAQRNDLNAVLSGIIRGVRENPQIDESMLIQLMDMFGFGHSVEWSRMIRENPQDVQKLANTFITESQRKSIKKAFDSITLTGGYFSNLRDQLVFELSPAIKSLSEGLREFLSKMIKGIKEGKFDDFFNLIRDDFKKFNEWINSLEPKDWEDIYTKLKGAMKTLYHAIKFFASVIEVAYKTFFTFLGAILGGIIGSLFGPAGTVIGAVAGTALGGGIDLIRAAGRSYDDSSDEEKAEIDKFFDWNGGIPNTEDIDAPEFNDSPRMNNVVKDAARRPTQSTTVYQTQNNYIDTTLNGLTDKEQADKFEEIIKDNTVNQKGFQIAIGRDYNLVYVSGETVGA